MTAAEFLANFGELANAPGGVARAREIILSMAVRGHLVPHDSQLAAVEAGQDFKPTEKDEVLDAEMYVPLLPENWTWTRFEWLGEIHGGLTPSMGRSEYWNGNIPWVSPKDMHTSVIRGSEMRVTPKALDLTSLKLVPSGSILFVTRSGILRRTLPVAITEVICVVNQDLKVLVPHNAALTQYLFTMLKGFEALILTELVKTGTTVQSLIFDAFRKKPFPLPPLAEQKRIVGKVDELMALCDQLEAQQQERERRFPVLSRTCHARFAEAPTPANLNRIFEETGSVSTNDLRTTILTLAVNGKLLAQDLDDEPVESLLARNDSHRQEVARKDRRADHENQSLLSPEDRWEIASAWAWRGLADLVLFVDYRGKTPTKVSAGVRLLTAKNVRKGEINLSPQEFLGEADYYKWMTRGFPKPGDVLFTTEAPMGNAAVVQLTERFALAQRVICFQSYGAVEASFLVMQILSSGFQLILERNGTGVTAKGIKASKLKRLPIAVPPLAEQRRIVAKVDELMALVDHLEAQQQEKDKLAEAFAKACVASFTGTSQLERPEKMKAPKTELVSLVTLGKKPKPEANAPLAQLLLKNKKTLPAKSLWQQSGLTIDAFYQQLKTELAQGWIAPPAEAEMKILDEA